MLTIARHTPLIVIVALLVLTVFNGATGKIAATIHDASDGVQWEAEP